MANPTGSLNTHLMSPDGVGGLWIADTTQVYYIDPTAAVSAPLTPFNDFSVLTIVEMIANPKDQSVWIANNDHLRRFSTGGQQLLERFISEADGLSRSIAHMNLFLDLTPPSLAFAAPTNGSATNDTQPTFILNYLDSGSGVDTTALEFSLNGSPWTLDCVAQETSAECVPVSPLADGTYEVVATVADNSENESPAANLSVAIDTVAPQITVTSPAQDSIVSNDDLTIAGSVSEPATFRIDGQPVSLNGSNQFSFPTTLEEGLNTFALQATDAAGNQGNDSLRVTLATDIIAPPNMGLIQVFDPGTGTITVTGAAGTVEANRLVRLTNTRTGVSVVVAADATGAFNGQIAGLPTDRIEVRAENAAGTQSEAGNVDVPGQALPGEPSAMATPLTQTGITPFPESISMRSRA